MHLERTMSDANFIPGAELGERNCHKLIERTTGDPCTWKERLVTHLGTVTHNMMFL